MKASTGSTETVTTMAVEIWLNIVLSFRFVVKRILLDFSKIWETNE